MKIPNVFISGEKSLDSKTRNLLRKKDRYRSFGDISQDDIKEIYSEYINSGYYKKAWKLHKKDPLSIEALERYFKGTRYENIRYEDALRIIEYAKERKDRFLEGLADL